jgi:hypothetical protein
VVPPFRPVPRVVEQIDASPSSRVPGGDAGDSGLALDELGATLGSEGVSELRGIGVGANCGGAAQEAKSLITSCTAALTGKKARRTSSR